MPVVLPCPLKFKPNCRLLWAQGLRYRAVSGILYGFWGWASSRTAQLVPATIEGDRRAAVPGQGGSQQPDGKWVLCAAWELPPVSQGGRVSWQPSSPNLGARRGARTPEPPRCKRGALTN